MFEVVNRRTKTRTALQLLELIFFWTVKSITGNSRNPLYKMLGEIAQSIAMMATFYLIMSAFGMRRTAPINGDVVMFLLTGVGLFMMHNKTMQGVLRAATPSDPIMQHAPMNTLVDICAAALSVLYTQFLTICAMLCAYHLYSGKVTIDRPVAALGVFVLAWMSGVCFGLLLRTIKLFAPAVAPMLSMLVIRSNMIFSGKMTPASTLPANILPMFAWNPLFHIIDALRGAVFLNYSSHRSDLGYTVGVLIVMAFIGLLGDFYARQAQHGRQ